MKKIAIMLSLMTSLFAAQSHAFTLIEIIAAQIVTLTGTEPQDVRVTESRASYYYTVQYTDRSGEVQSAECQQEGINDALGDLNCTITSGGTGR